MKTRYRQKREAAGSHGCAPTRVKHVSNGVVWPRHQRRSFAAIDIFHSSLLMPEIIRIRPTQQALRQAAPGSYLREHFAFPCTTSHASPSRSRF